MVESSPSRQRRPPCKTSKEMSDEAADAAALTYLLTITIKATLIAALAHSPQRRFIERGENLIVINGDIFEHLAPEMICPAWLCEEMTRADTLICGSQTVVDNMFDVLETETDRRLNDDFNAPRMANMLRVPIFSWPVKWKPAGDPTTFEVRWLLISSPDSWSRKV